MNSPKDLNQNSKQNNQFQSFGIAPLNQIDQHDSSQKVFPRTQKKEGGLSQMQNSPIHQKNNSQLSRYSNFFNDNNYYNDQQNNEQLSSKKNKFSETYSQLKNKSNLNILNNQQNDQLEKKMIAQQEKSDKIIQTSYNGNQMQVINQFKQKVELNDSFQQNVQEEKISQKYKNSQNNLCQSLQKGENTIMAIQKQSIEEIQQLNELVDNIEYSNQNQQKIQQEINHYGKPLLNSKAQKEKYQIHSNEKQQKDQQEQKDNTDLNQIIEQIGKQSFESKDGSIGAQSKVKGVSQKRYDDQEQRDSKLSEHVLPSKLEANQIVLQSPSKAQPKQTETKINNQVLQASKEAAYILFEQENSVNQILSEKNSVRDSRSQRQAQKLMKKSRDFEGGMQQNEQQQFIKKSLIQQQNDLLRIIGESSDDKLEKSQKKHQKQKYVKEGKNLLDEMDTVLLMGSQDNNDRKQIKVKKESNKKSPKNEGSGKQDKLIRIQEKEKKVAKNEEKTKKQNKKYIDREDEYDDVQIGNNSVEDRHEQRRDASQVQGKVKIIKKKAINNYNIDENNEQESSENYRLQKVKIKQKYIEQNELPQERKKQIKDGIKMFENRKFSKNSNGNNISKIEKMINAPISQNLQKNLGKNIQKSPINIVNQKQKPLNEEPYLQNLRSNKNKKINQNLSQISFFTKESPKKQISEFQKQYKETKKQNIETNKTKRMQIDINDFRTLDIQKNQLQIINSENFPQKYRSPQPQTIDQQALKQNSKNEKKYFAPQNMLPKVIEEQLQIRQSYNSNGGKQKSQSRNVDASQLRIITDSEIEFSRDNKFVDKDLHNNVNSVQHLLYQMRKFSKGVKDILDVGNTNQNINMSREGIDFKKQKQSGNEKKEDYQLLLKLQQQQIQENKMRIGEIINQRAQVTGIQTFQDGGDYDARKDFEQTLQEFMPQMESHLDLRKLKENNILKHDYTQNLRQSRITEEEINFPSDSAVSSSRAVNQIQRLRMSKQYNMQNAGSQNNNQIKQLSPDQIKQIANAFQEQMIEKDHRTNEIKRKNKSKTIKEGYESDFSMFKLNQKGERVEIFDQGTASLVRKVNINPQLLNDMSNKKQKIIESQQSSMNINKDEGELNWKNEDRRTPIQDQSQQQFQSDTYFYDEDRRTPIEQQIEKKRAQKQYLANRRSGDIKEVYNSFTSSSVTEQGIKIDPKLRDSLRLKHKQKRINIENHSIVAQQNTDNNFNIKKEKLNEQSQIKKNSDAANKKTEDENTSKTLVKEGDKTNQKKIHQQDDITSIKLGSIGTKKEIDGQKDNSKTIIYEDPFAKSAIDKLPQRLIEALGKKKQKEMAKHNEFTGINISEKESEEEKVINIQLHISPNKKGGKEPQFQAKIIQIKQDSDKKHDGSSKKKLSYKKLNKKMQDDGMNYPIPNNIQDIIKKEEADSERNDKNFKSTWGGNVFNQTKSNININSQHSNSQSNFDRNLGGTINSNQIYEDQDRNFRNLQEGISPVKTFGGQYDRGHITIKDGEEFVDNTEVLRRQNKINKDMESYYTGAQHLRMSQQVNGQSIQPTLPGLNKYQFSPQMQQIGGPFLSPNIHHAHSSAQAFFMQGPNQNNSGESLISGSNGSQQNLHRMMALQTVTPLYNFKRKDEDQQFSNNMQNYIQQNQFQKDSPFINQINNQKQKQKMKKHLLNQGGSSADDEEGIIKNKKTKMSDLIQSQTLAAGISEDTLRRQTINKMLRQLQGTEGQIVKQLSGSKLKKLKNSKKKELELRKSKIKEQIKDLYDPNSSDEDKAVRASMKNSLKKQTIKSKKLRQSKNSPIQSMDQSQLLKKKSKKKIKQEASEQQVKKIIGLPFPIPTGLVQNPQLLKKQHQFLEGLQQFQNANMLSPVNSKSSIIKLEKQNKNRNSSTRNQISQMIKEEELQRLKNAQRQILGESRNQSLIQDAQKLNDQLIQQQINSQQNMQNPLVTQNNYEGYKAEAFDPIDNQNINQKQKKGIEIQSNPLRNSFKDQQQINQEKLLNTINLTEQLNYFNMQKQGMYTNQHSPIQNSLYMPQLPMINNQNQILNNQVSGQFGQNALPQGYPSYLMGANRLKNNSSLMQESEKIEQLVHTKKGFKGTKVKNLLSSPSTQNVLERIKLAQQQTEQIQVVQSQLQLAQAQQNQLQEQLNMLQRQNALAQQSFQQPSSYYASNDQKRQGLLPEIQEARQK